jgi:hypothetical protein
LREYVVAIAGRVEFVAVAAALEATMSTLSLRRTEQEKTGKHKASHKVATGMDQVGAKETPPVATDAIGGREEEMTHGSSVRRAVAVAMPRSMKRSTAWLLPII